MLTDREIDARIERLRAELPTATDFARLHERFLDDLGFHAEVHERSVRERNEYFELCLAKSVAVVVGPDVRARVESFRVRDSDLWHGRILAGEHFGAYFGFQSIGMVCVGIARLDGRATYSRVSVTARPVGPRSTFYGPTRGVA